VPTVPGRTWAFSVTADQTGDTTVLRLAGRFGHKAAADFERAAAACLDSGVGGVVIDLAGVDYLSSPGLRAIVSLAGKLQDRRGQVIVRGARDAVRVTLGLADFTRTRQRR
jgi:anti-anti-sigma factor